MNSAVLVPIRLSSSRLPKKHLIPVMGKPFLVWMLDRLKFFCKELDFIVITTIHDHELQEFCNLNSIKCFLGDENNIPKRCYQASKLFKLDNIILVDGDDITCSENAIMSTYNLLKAGHKHVVTSGLPLGMNAFGFSYAYLHSHYEQFKDKKIFQTGCWGPLFGEKEKSELKYPAYYQEHNKLRFTLDYPEDAEFFSKIILHFKEKFVSTDYASIVEYIVENKQYEINAFLDKVYWENFNKEKQWEQV